MARKKIKNTFVTILAIYIAFVIGDRLFILYKIDKTLEPSYYLEYSRKNNGKSFPPVYLVSYAGKKSVFFKNQNAQAMSAINNGIDHIMMYKRRDIDQEFYENNKRILDVPVGDGLWIWKPYFILKTMDFAPQDSLIIYADSPVIFKNPTNLIINRLQEHDVLLLLDGTLRKKNVQKIGTIIQKEFLKPFNLDYNQFQNENNLWSCFVAVRNNKTGRAFVEQWLQNCQQGLRSTPYFDQTMLVIAAYQKPDGIYVMDVDEAMKTIKNVHRHPNDEYKSLLPDMVSGYFKWFKLSEWGYNARWVKWIRSQL